MKNSNGNEDSRSMASQERSRTRQTRTWAHIVRLAEEALAALDARKPTDAREQLKAIGGLARNADQAGSWEGLSDETTS